MSDARIQRVLLGSGVDSSESSNANGIPSTAAIAPKANLIPVVEEDLLNYLDKLFPVHLQAAYSIRDYDRQVGARSVIDHLKALYSEQNPLT